jgi:hypothetical protein
MKFDDAAMSEVAGEARLAHLDGLAEQEEPPEGWEPGC